MDQSNYEHVTKMARTERNLQKVDFLLNLTEPGKNKEVPDPWYKDELFEAVFRMVHEACKKLI